MQHLTYKMSSRKNLRTEITWCIIHILTKRVANDRNISSRRSFVYPRFFFLTYLLAASTSCSSASSQEACSINRDADKRKKNGLRRDIKNDLESDRICAPVGGDERKKGALLILPPFPTSSGADHTVFATVLNNNSFKNF